jgi:hypothetical protein
MNCDHFAREHQACLIDPGKGLGVGRIRRFDLSRRAAR